MRNSVAMDFLNLSFRQVQAARDKLKSAGLIDFKTVNGSGMVSYSLFDVELQTFAAIAKVNAKVVDEVTVQVDATVNHLHLGINNKLKQKLKTSPSFAHDENFLEDNFNNTEYYSHEEVEKATLLNQKFIDAAVQALNTNTEQYQKFCAGRLAQMRITGESTKYTLGTLRKILLQDFKAETTTNKKQSGWTHPEEKPQERKIGRIAESDLQAFLNRRSY